MLRSAVRKAPCALQRGAPSARGFSAATAPLSESVPLTFLRPGGVRTTVAALKGDTLLDVAQEFGIDEVEGACEGTCACSTCHMIIPQSYYDKLGEPGEDELDMLDLALALTDHSRLGCQVIVSDLIAGMEITLPEEVADMQ